MKILGIDPGIKATGWCLLNAGKVVSRGVIQRPGRAKATWAVLFGIWTELEEVLFATTPELVVVEDYVWYGRQRGFATLCKLVGGIVARVHRHAQIKVITPKEKGAKKKPRKGWSQHETDAYWIAKTRAKGKVSV